MKRNIFISCIILASLFLLALPAGAQMRELNYDHRVPGDRALTLRLGPVFPLFFQSPEGTVKSTHLSTVGGTLGLDIDFYLTNEFRLGGSIGGLGAFSPNNKTLFMVPFTFKSTYEFKIFPFSIPVSLAAGFCMTSFRDSSNVEPILMPSVGGYWNMNSSWSFGLDLSCWIDFQYYTGSPIPYSESRIGYFMPLTLGTVYHF